MSFSFPHFLCILFSCLLLVQIANAAIFPQQIIESEQPSQIFHDEDMMESHDCCEEQAEACCEACEQGCQCAIGSVTLSAPDLTISSRAPHSSPVLLPFNIYPSQTNDLPERPPRA